MQDKRRSAMLTERLEGIRQREGFRVAQQVYRDLSPERRSGTRGWYAYAWLLERRPVILGLIGTLLATAWAVFAWAAD